MRLDHVGQEKIEMKNTKDDEICIRLTKEEAIVLFEFVSRFSEDRKLTIEDQAEERVLWDLCCTLESNLVEPLTPEYAQVLAQARNRIRDTKED